MSTFKQIATALINRGITVVPVQPREKRCTLLGWQNAATTDPTQIAEWNAENPNYNVGAVAKPDGVWILDADNPALSSIIESNCKQAFPDTFMVKSGKGYHYYFKQTDASRAMGNVKEGGLFDAQVNNKYVVGPGSIHPSGATYTVLNDVDPVEAPQFLIDWVIRYQVRQKSAVVSNSVLTGVEAKAEMKTKVQWLVNFLTGSSATVYSKKPVAYGEGYKVYVECPNSEEHSEDNGITQTAVMALNEGGYSFVCQHGHCKGLDWDWFKSEVEEEIDFDDPEFKVEWASAEPDPEPEEEPVEVVAEADEEEIPPSIVGEINLTNSGNAKRLVRGEGHNIKFCHSKKKWYVWTGKRWLEDDRGVIYRKAERIVQTAIMADGNLAVIGMEDDEKVDKILDGYRKFAMASESKKGLDAMVQLAANQQGIPVRITDFDTDADLFNVSNGIINLSKGDLTPAKRKNLCTKLANVEFTPEADCPRWKEFLNTIFNGNKDLIAFIQRCVGYSLTASTIEQCFFLLHGSGANGKSTLLHILGKLMGEYAQTAEFTSFTAKQGEQVRNDLAKLVGARLVMASEGDSNKRFSEAIVKQLTGGDKISARFLYGEYFEFLPQFKLFLATNHKPKVIGQDHGFWRRVRLIPFSVEIPLAEQDMRLEEKLEKELPGILNWALEGLRAWQENGLQAPAEVLAATKEYREEEDALQAFIDENCVINKSFQAPAAELYHKYSNWAKDCNEYVVNNREFAKRLQEKGFAKKKTKKGLRYTGLSLRFAEEHTAEAEEELIQAIQ